mgnify:FL=1
MKFKWFVVKNSVVQIWPCFKQHLLIIVCICYIYKKCTFILIHSYLLVCAGEKWTLGGTVCPFGPGGGPIVHASYHHRINDTLQIGAEFETASGMGESSASGGYQLDIPNVGITFKGKSWSCFLYESHF